MRTSCPAFCSTSGKRTLVGGDSSRLKGARAKGRPPEVAAARGRLTPFFSTLLASDGGKLGDGAAASLPQRGERRDEPEEAPVAGERHLVLERRCHGLEPIRHDPALLVGRSPRGGGGVQRGRVFR